MASKTYRLRIVSDGKEFEAEGDKAFVLDMVKRHAPNALTPASLDKKPEPPALKERVRQVALPVHGKGVSLREFIQQLALKKQTDIALAFGYYLEKHQGNADFSAADVNNCYYEAKMEASNTSQMIINNIKGGRMMPSKQKGEKGRKRFTLTATGEKFVDSKLSAKK